VTGGTSTNTGGTSTNTGGSTSGGTSQGGSSTTTTGGKGAATGGGKATGGSSATGGTGAATGGSATGGKGTVVTVPDPCIQSGQCPVGVWTHVTPAKIDLTGTFDCGNFGTESVQVDPMAPSNLYTEFNCQGVYKSTDYGLTWQGPINTGKNGAQVQDTAGGIVIPANGTTQPPVIYSAGIRGQGTGIWKSVNGGVDWTNYPITPSGARQDYYPPEIDPYDTEHLLMAGHEMSTLVESKDGGKTWTAIPLDPGMAASIGTAALFFIDTGTASTTRTTWLWTATQSGGIYGTWRTTNAGATWTHVDKNEHPHSTTQIYQPDGGGVVYMAGAYSDLGWGVLRSTDYGATWKHVGSGGNMTLVFGTAKNVYSMFGWAIGPGQTVDPGLQLTPQPGAGAWTALKTPATMTQGPGHVAVTSDGTHSIILAACYNGGLWRYIEP